MTDDSLRLFQPDDGTWEELCRKIRGEAAPFYLFHEPKAREHVQALRRSLGGTAKIAYAMKANPWLARATGADYIEVCSPTELDICARQQIPGKQLLADGIWQSDSFLERALKMGVGRFAVQSCSQLERLLSLSRGRPLSVLLRVTSGNQFGMDCEELKTCLTAFGRDGRVKGLQYYPGTQRRDIRQVRRDLACLREWISGCEHLGAPLEEIEFGAGIGVPYFQGESPEDYAALLDVVAEWIQEMEPRCRITYEAGRLITASCGIYVTEVFAQRRRGNRHFLFCSGGTNHLRYHGGALGVRTPLLRGLCAAPTGVGETTTVCGPLCSESDVLVRECHTLDSGITAGDRIVFFGAGAYSATESPNVFLGLAFPHILLYNGLDITISPNPVGLCCDTAEKSAHGSDHHEIACYPASSHRNHPKAVCGLRRPPQDTAHYGGDRHPGGTCL
ncbi:alanine racemase [uncultured Oscillibacter sp.]|jgi:diaminopimelate decarboxylase|uniref:alanine racemase n=1 Tax=uncultured Oscillibacter sp. TaxID=876091 RepID=UPI002619F79F|nr:alanine racemase [uncultured Oscillibacter sp.]